MKPTRTESIENKEIFVFDNVISEKHHNALAKSVEALPYTHGHRDSAKVSAQYGYYVMYLKTKDALALPIGEKVLNLAAEHFPREKILVRSVYVNRMSFGDVTFQHRDYASSKPYLSVVYFLNQQWDRRWGGETIFFDRTGEARLAVAPAPRRLILFRGAILHRIGIPTRLCPTGRLTLAMKFGRHY